MSKNKKHIHSELIKAWADGAKIQYRYEGVREWHDWASDVSPLWSANIEYRIKPEEPWKPKAGEEYFYFSDDGVVEDKLWNDSITDEGRYEIGNCFRTKEEAEATAARIKAILNGEAKQDTILDGKPLTGGEKALIKALREAAGILAVYPVESALACKDEDGNLRISSCIVSFETNSNEYDEQIRSALKQIQAEQEREHERIKN